mmetsp:Transcript_27232/g.78333  ORF Transcript_27232/g.78333 Transcript_27232/m.78333 type:complete len:131 (-) Transcript_27232:834-1226(-)
MGGRCVMSICCSAHRGSFDGGRGMSFLLCMRVSAVYSRLRTRECVCVCVCVCKCVECADCVDESSDRTWQPDLYLLYWMTFVSTHTSSRQSHHTHTCPAGQIFIRQAGRQTGREHSSLMWTAWCEQLDET